MGVEGSDFLDRRAWGWGPGASRHGTRSNGTVVWLSIRVRDLLSIGVWFGVGGNSPSVPVDAEAGTGSAGAEDAGVAVEEAQLW